MIKRCQAKPGRETAISKSFILRSDKINNHLEYYLSFAYQRICRGLVTYVDTRSCCCCCCNFHCCRWPRCPHRSLFKSSKIEFNARYALLCRALLCKLSPCVSLLFYFIAFQYIALDGLQTNYGPIVIHDL